MGMSCYIGSIFFIEIKLVGSKLVTFIWFNVNCAGQYMHGSVCDASVMHYYPYQHAASVLVSLQ